MSELIETQKYTSYEDVSQSSGKGLTYINYIPDGSTTVRFLSEPTEWIQYPEWYDVTKKRPYPVLRNSNIELPDGERISKRFLAPALLCDDDEVVTLKLPKTAVEQLFVSYDRNGTVMDRDFDIIRSGEGLKTSYQVYPGEKMKRPLNKYEVPNVNEVLDSWCREVIEENNGGKVEQKPKEDKPVRQAPKRDTEEPEFTTKEEQEEYRQMLQEMMVEDENVLNEMELNELKEHLSIFGKTSRSKNTAVLVRMLKKEIQS